VTEFTGVPAKALMNRPAVTIDAGASLDEARQLFARSRYTAFPVTASDGRAIGMLSRDHLERSYRARRRADP
jgi:CBS domain-containing protein